MVDMPIYSEISCTRNLRDLNQIGFEFPAIDWFAKWPMLAEGRHLILSNEPGNS
jgi:hypothetical protein